MVPSNLFPFHSSKINMEVTTISIPKISYPNHSVSRKRGIKFLRRKRPALRSLSSSSIANHPSPRQQEKRDQTSLKEQGLQIFVFLFHRHPSITQEAGGAAMVSLKEMARLDAERAPPAWLHRMLETTFFEACPKHPGSTGHANRRTAGCNFFCTDCTSHAICSSCLSNHAGHEIIQIRKLSGSNAVKVEDVRHLLNVSLVQTYLINGEDAVFLNSRPMSGQGRPGAYRCEECERGLFDEACRFCSLGCKAKGIIEDRPDFSVSFAVDPNDDISDESGANDEESSSST